MPLSPDDVIAAYQLILGRQPESEGVIALHAAAHEDRLALGLSLMSSDEAKRRAGISVSAAWLQLSRMGFGQSDRALLHEVAAPVNKAQPGFFTDFLGQRTRSSFLADVSAFEGKVGGLPLPADFHAEAAEWIAFIKALKAAPGRLIAAELGAGWGPWTASAHALAQRFGLSPVKLYAVEADPGFFARLQQHMQDNAIPSSVLDLRNAVLTIAGGMREWSVRDASGSDYGARIPEANEAADYRGLPVGSLREMPGLSLSGFLQEEPVWDLIHIDLQGIEEELCRAAMVELTSRVRHVIVATHSKSLDAGCFEVFHQAGWNCVMNTSPLIAHERGLSTIQAMTRIDGMQLWQNPLLTE
jgi:FkbM family methyltransferase